MATKTTGKPERKRRGDFAILSRPVGYAGVAQAFEVRVIARGEGYALVRRKGCMPFVVDAKELVPSPDCVPTRSAASYCQEIVDVIIQVENRCMAVDGPVTPTSAEITDADLRKIYRAAQKGSRL